MSWWFLPMKTRRAAAAALSRFRYILVVYFIFASVDIVDIFVIIFWTRNILRLDKAFWAAFLDFVIVDFNSSSRQKKSCNEFPEPFRTNFVEVVLSLTVPLTMRRSSIKSENKTREQNCEEVQRILLQLASGDLGFCIKLAVSVELSKIFVTIQ